MRKMRDRRIPFLFVSSPNSHSQQHHEVVAFLVHVLYSLGIPVNYDHIKTTVPKHEEIPLVYHDEHGTHTADIAFLVGDNVIALIEIKTRRLDSKFYQRLRDKEERGKGHGNR